MAMISLQVATQIALSAFEEGKKRNVVNMSVVVTDPGGHVRVAMRADGQGIFGIETATGKAITALGFNRPSLQLAKSFGPEATAAISGATGGRFVPLGGAVIVRDGTDNIVGAAAVSGGAPAVDEEIIAAACETAGFVVARSV